MFFVVLSPPFLLAGWLGISIQDLFHSSTFRRISLFKSFLQLCHPRVRRSLKKISGIQVELLITLNTGTF